ncbi:hypothetical protein D3C76_1405150 [compost metagenome]
MLRHFDIGIEERQPLTAAGLHATVAQGADGQPRQAQHLGTEAAGDLRAVIAGAVVDHHQLAFEAGIGGGLHGRPQGPGNVPGLVEHRHHDADFHAFTCASCACSAFRRSTLDSASMIHRYFWFGALKNIRNKLIASMLMHKCVSRSAWS